VTEQRLRDVLTLFLFALEQTGFNHNSKKCHDAGFDVLTAVAMIFFIFCDTAPCSPLKVNGNLGGTRRLHYQGRRMSHAIVVAVFFTLVSCLIYSSILKMETAYLSETSAVVKRTPQHYVPEGRTLEMP
jgi:hypothetical protein